MIVRIYHREYPVEYPCSRKIVGMSLYRQNPCDNNNLYMYIDTVYIYPLRQTKNKWHLKTNLQYGFSLYNLNALS